MRPVKRYWTRLSGALISTALLLGACGPSGGVYTALTADRPLAQLSEGLTVSANPAALGQDFGVQLRAFNADLLANAQAGDAVNAAFAARPPLLTLVSPLFTLSAQGAAPAQLFVSLIAPEGADANLLDLYAWDGKAWSFLPAQARGGQRVATVSTLPQVVGLFQAAPPAPLALVRIDPGDTLPAGAPVNGALLGGVSAQPDGSLGGVLPNLPVGLTYPLYPVIHGDAGQIGNLISDPAVRAAHLQTLVDFTVAGSYAGLALEYRNVADTQKADFSAFVNGLHTQLHAQNKLLLVYLDLPASPTAPLGGYDWRALGASADALLTRLPADPAALGGGVLDTALTWAAGEVERGRLRLATSALAVVHGAAGFSLTDQASALATLGSAQSASLPEALYAGQPVTLTLSGQGQRLDFDALAFAPRYAYQADGQTLTVWLTTAGAVRRRLALAEKYRLGGVLLEDIFHTGVPSSLLQAVADYQASAGTPDQAQVGLLWTVNGGGGVVAQATAQPAEPYVFVPSAAGDYQVSVQVHVGGAASDLGSVPVKVAEVPATPTPAPTVTRPSGGSTGGSGSSGGNTGNTGGSGNSGNTGNTGGNSGGFVPPPPVASGTFQLGGQVPGFIGHAAQMKQAGMTWVKFQGTGDTGGMIAAGHGNGFKVLISALGDKSRAADPSYWPEYAAWVAGIASQGADAIEVWNEANIDREWPTGQINGATYTELLKQAYAAIKAANSGTLVISGAPAPTGAEAAFPGRVMNDNNFLSQMAAAGAANYMDCVGVHYNEGVVSPTQSGGDPRDNFYSRYYPSMVDLYYGAFQGSRQLCFTELGYLTPEGYGSLPGFFAWAGGNTVAEQAQWLAEAASLSGSSGKVRLMVIFNVDFTLWGDDPQAGYAILRPDGSCPACAALDAVMP